MLRKAFAAGAALLAAGCSVVGAGVRAPEPPFEVVARLDPSTEIRRYGPRAAVVTSMEGGESAAFGRLFDYASGANTGGARIAMTAPVAESGRGERIAMTTPVAVDAREMTFFLPPDMPLDEAPAPTAAGVSLRGEPEQLIATRRWSGLRGGSAVSREDAALRAALVGSGWEAAGPTQAWFFDPPWTLPPFRRNEVAVPVTPR